MMEASDIDAEPAEAEPTHAEPADGEPLGEWGRTEIAQTLDRGIRVLQLLADSPNGLTVAEIASQLGVGRTVARRLAATLRARRLVTATDTGFKLGIGLLELSRRVEPGLRAVAETALDRVANETNETAFVSVRDGDDVVAFAIVEPSNVQFALTWRGRFRHSVHTGAAGIAVRAIREPRPGDAPEVVECRQRGWAVSRGSLDAGAVGVAVPLDLRPWGIEAAVGVVSFKALDETAAARVAMQAARKIRSHFSG